MSTASVRSRIGRHVDLDWHAGMLVGLLLLVQLAAIRLATTITAHAGATGSTSLPAQTSSPETGGLWVGIVVVESIVLVVLWRYASLVPDWVWTGLKWGILAGLFLSVAWVGYALHDPLHWTGVILLACVLGPALVRFDLNWTVHNLLALSFAVGGATMLGFALSPRVVLVLLALLTVWDMVAVWASDWMDGLVGMAASTSLPVYVILPSALQIDLSGLREWLVERDGAKPDGVAGILGVGDLAIPTALTVSAVVALPDAWPAIVTGAVVGGVAGMVVLRSSLAGETVPALPWLTTGTVAGFALGVVASGASLLAVLGGSVA